MLLGIATRLLIAGFAGFLCLSCAHAQAIVDPERTPTDNRWVVVGTAADKVRSPAQPQAFLKFGSDGRLTGSTGCDTVNGRFEADSRSSSGKVSFSDVVFTGDTGHECGPAEDRSKTAMVRLLDQDVEFTIIGDSLELVAS